MTLTTIQTYLAGYLKASFSSVQRFLILLATLVALFYLPTWLIEVGKTIVAGGSECIINMGFIALFFQAIWRDRQALLCWEVNEEDRLIGQILIVSGVLGFPFVRDSVSFQAVAFAWILMGVLLSQWGLQFFRKYSLESLLLIISIYPNLNFIAIRVFRFFTGEDMLERVMAFLGSLGLQAFGQSAVSNLALVTLPEGSVLVAPGCNGFSMAFTLAGTSFVLGLFMKLGWRKITALTLVGIAIALVFNVPRIMLLANAAVYWGEASFDFWHGAWGGQIFASVMFTVYYYVAMAIIDGKKSPA